MPLLDGRRESCSSKSTAVTVYFLSKQLLLFAFAGRYNGKPYNNVYYDVYLHDNAHSPSRSLGCLPNARETALFFSPNVGVKQLL